MTEIFTMEEERPFVDHLDVSLKGESIVGHNRKVVEKVLLEDEHDQLVKLVLVFMTLYDGFLFCGELFGKRNHKNEWNLSLTSFRALI